MIALLIASMSLLPTAIAQERAAIAKVAGKVRQGHQAPEASRATFQRMAVKLHPRLNPTRSYPTARSRLTPNEDFSNSRTQFETGTGIPNGVPVSSSMNARARLQLSSKLAETHICENKAATRPLGLGPVPFGNPSSRKNGTWREAIRPKSKFAASAKAIRHPSRKASAASSRFDSGSNQQRARLKPRLVSPCAISDVTLHSTLRTRLAWL